MNGDPDSQKGNRVIGFLLLIILCIMKGDLCIVKNVEQN